MKDHRIRLTEDDIILIIAALRARAAATAGERQHRVWRLVARLSEGTPGNPQWILGQDGQQHEISKDAADRTWPGAFRT